MNRNTIGMEEAMFFSQLLNSCSALELLKQILANSHHAIVITDADRANGYRIVYANKVFCYHTGYDLAELVGQSPSIFQGPQSNQRVLAKLSKALQERGYFYGSSINYRKDGSMYPVEWNISAILDSEGKPTHYISMQKDLTNMLALVEQVKYSNEIFKEHLLDKSNKESRRTNPKVIEELKKNAKLYNANFRSQTNCELFEEAFFDFSPGEKGALGARTDKAPLSAEHYWSENPIFEEDLAGIRDVLQELEAEIYLIESNGITHQRCQNVAKYYKEVANGLFFCVEFNDGALLIDEVAETLKAQSGDDSFPAELLVMFNNDLFSWINDVFVTKRAQDIYEGEKNTITAGNQLMSFINVN
ncbi:PAS domain-containing protein (plasmid) [Pseudoalteromonas sp. T1lg65]|uniref:PAS domain-containing protein n=1 Tax=Pseudoalteromonas sp. T1lg65 TaxID=2077101 RepID=UPI003F7AFC70